MRILITIVHYWDQRVGGRHASLRSPLEQRLYALQDQLLALKRMSSNQGVLNISSKSVDDANQSLRHSFDIKVVTDGTHHVVDHMEDCYREMFEHVITNPHTAKHLGFEAHRVLEGGLDQDYDLYAYFEDDLIVHDPLFFHKIFWFQQNVGKTAVLMPHRYEYYWKPVDTVDRFYIDGPMENHELRVLIPDPPSPLTTPLPGGQVAFSSPENPHSGCFVLTRHQMKVWSQKSWFMDLDSTLISPLESAATLGITKTFTLFKPHYAYASFLELQHWGTSFRALIGSQIRLST